MTLHAPPLLIIGFAVVGCVMLFAVIICPPGSSRNKMIFYTVVWWVFTGYLSQTSFQQTKTEESTKWVTLQAAANDALAKRDRENAERFYKEAVQVAEEQYGKDDLRVATSSFYLASSLMRREQYGLSEPHFRKALSIQEKKLGSNYPDTIETRKELAAVLTKLGRDDEAKKLMMSRANVK